MDRYVIHELHGKVPTAVADLAHSAEVEYRLDLTPNPRRGSGSR